MPPRRIGRYETQRLLGAGGMGEVHLATDTGLRRPVALKILPREWTGDPTRRARLLREAQLAAALSHPHIATVYDVFEHQGSLVLAMEYVRGASLRTLLSQGALPVRQALRVGAQAADALAAAHRQGIVHRDVKPDNILVTDDGNAKLLDFGVARPILSADAEALANEPTLTEDGALVGTAAYMAPEQIRGRPAEPESDIFALGATLYEILTGTRPFGAGPPGEVMARILRDDPPAPTTVAHDLPPELDRILLRALAKEPAERYRDAHELAHDLRTVRLELETGERLERTGSLSPPPARRRRVAAGIVVVGLAIAIGLVARLATRDGPTPSELPSRLRLLVALEDGIADPRLSPDGAMIAYVVEGPGRSHLYAMRSAGGARVRLTEDRAAKGGPVFSPDGERIAFSRTDPQSGAPDVWEVPALGGAARRVLSNASGLAWSPDGARMAFIRWEDRGPGDLVVRDADGGDARVLVAADAEFPFLRNPRWSPDGRRIVFDRGRGGIAVELWTVPSDGGAPRRLVEDPAGVFSRNGVFTPDGGRVVHVSNRGGAENLWTVSSEGGGRAVPLTTGPGPDHSPSVARDGKIAFLNSRSRTVLLRVGLEGGEPVEIARHTSAIWAPAYSPDGREIAFARAEEGGSWRIWVLPADGGAERPITDGSTPEIYPRWSPDGAWIYFQTWSPEPDRVFKVDPRGGPPVPVTREGVESGYADPSPDGKGLLFTRREGGGDRVFLLDLATGAERPLGPSPSTVARWSPDGRRIAFARNRGYEEGIFVVNADGTGESRISLRGGWPVFAPDGRSIAYQVTDEMGNTEVRLTPLDGGRTTTLPGIAFLGVNNPFDLSPDGRSWVAVNRRVVGSEIWLLEP